MQGDIEAKLKGCNKNQTCSKSKKPLDPFGEKTKKKKGAHKTPTEGKKGDRRTHQTWNSPLSLGGRTGSHEKRNAAKARRGSLWSAREGEQE